MSANRPKDTKPELLLRRALWHAGHRGYRVNYRIKFRTPQSAVRTPSVRPDISFVSKKTAIFVHGCYWHRCPKCKYPLPKTNTAFWTAKFERNVARDEQKRKELRRLGWKVITVWECDLKKRFSATLNRILRTLG
ncbi:MAG: very short patch repair endonuclease [Chloracidobacterium sp.]|nr:very short patch repair endonuclease [Chloracidobacterium sp.]